MVVHQDQGTEGGFNVERVPTAGTPGTLKMEKVLE